MSHPTFLSFMTEATMLEMIADTRGMAVLADTFTGAGSVLTVGLTGFLGMEVRAVGFATVSRVFK